MKNTRKLIPAIAMLLVSAVMMSTASFAWFTMNSEVKATGMEVTAIAPDSIWISQNKTEAWTSSIKLEFETDGSQAAPEVYTPSTPDLKSSFKAWTFKKLTTAASALVSNIGKLPDSDGEKDGVTADGKVIKDGVDLGEAYEASTSFFKDIIKIKLDAEAGKSIPVYVNASVSYDKNQLTDKHTKIDDIYKAFRIAVAVNGKTVVLEPTAYSDATETIKFAALADGTESNELLTLIGGAEATEVAVYVWIEGNDDDCKNDNALNTDDFTIDLYFSIDNAKKLTAPAVGG